MCRSVINLVLRVAAMALIAGVARGATDPALIGWWTFDEGSGNVTADLSPNHNDGHFFQGPPVWVAGVHGTAVELTKPTLIEIPAVNLTLSEATLAGWIKPYGAQTNWAAIIMHRPTAHGFNVLSDFQLAYHWNDDSSSWNYRSQVHIVDNEWSFAALTIQPAKATFYLNGVASAANAITHNPAQWNANIYLGGDGSGDWDDRRMVGALDDVSLFSRALIEEEIKGIMLGPASPGLAGAPVPKSGAVDVPRDVVLGWQAGQFAHTHDVYFGTSFDDVNTANRTVPLGVLASQGQDANTYDPPGLLAFGQTYYWRVDEANAPPTDWILFRGRVCSFTAETYGYPIATPIKATASSQSNANMGPEKTIDGSGLSDDRHSTTPQNMWFTKKNVLPNWIKYELDRVYGLHQMWVWNSNQVVEPQTGYGAKDVTIEYSTDDVTWTTLAGVPQFGRATGDSSYVHNTTVDFGSVLARYVRLTVNSNWGAASKQTGLSEVRFFYVPVKAYGPTPASGATGVPVDGLLNWRPARRAAGHEVYLGTDPNAVLSGTVQARTVTEHRFGLGSAGVEYDRTYYWKVNEVNEAQTPRSWEGDVWSFSTPGYSVVDDFESYNDKCNRVFFTWLDGSGHDGAAECGVAMWAGNGTGATVGYRTAPYAEQTIVRNGVQSLPLAYDNTAGKTCSEAERRFTVPRDWTQGGVRTLMLTFHGDLNNGAGQLYVKINDTKVDYDGSPNLLAMPIWTQWNIDLTSAGGDLQAVKILAIGVSGSGKGTLYIDDIRLYRSAPAVLRPVDPGAAGLEACYTMEDSLSDVSGHGYEGTASSAPAFIDAPAGYGKAIQLTAANSDYVDLPIGPLVNTLSSATITAWVYYSSTSDSWQRIFDFGNDPNAYMFMTTSAGTSGVLRFAIRAATSTAESIVTSPGKLSPGWHPVAVVIDGTRQTLHLYADGVVVASGPTATLPKDLGSTTHNWLGRSQFASDAYFDGELDEFRIYSRALSAGEVRYLAGDQ